MIVLRSTCCNAPDFRCILCRHQSFEGVAFRTSSGLPRTAGPGDPVTHVDVTADGSWILGTCANYLVLLDTSLMGGARGREPPAECFV